MVIFLASQVHQLHKTGQTFGSKKCCACSLLPAETLMENESAFQKYTEFSNGFWVMKLKPDMS